ncbi:MAG: hypothetical protein KC621_11450, partial [Myxococcales bacterium]|nr:hypothetical protein [Myxococcales bacterium]
MDDADRRYLEEAFDHWIRSGYGLDTLADELEERAEDLVGPLEPEELRWLEGFVADGLAAQ